MQKLIHVYEKSRSLKQDGMSRNGEGRIFFCATALHENHSADGAKESLAPERYPNLFIWRILCQLARQEIEYLNFV